MTAGHKLLPYLALGVTILTLGFAAFFVRWAQAPAPVMGFYRLGLATLILTPFFVRHSLRARPASATGGWKAGLVILPILAGLGSGFDHFFWNSALGKTSVANATLLGNTSPLWVALAAWLLFRQKLGRLFWLGLALTLGGAAVVLGSDFLRHPSLGWGDLFGVTSSLFYAAFYIFSERSRRHFDTLTHVWICSLSSTLLLLALSLATHASLTGYSPRTWLVFLAAALFPQLAGYLCMGYALGHLPASIVSPTMLGQPVLTALLAIPLLGESLLPAQWLGGAVVLGGIYLIHRSRQHAQVGVPDGMPPE